MPFMPPMPAWAWAAALRRISSSRARSTAFFSLLRRSSRLSRTMTIASMIRKGKVSTIKRMSSCQKLTKPSTARPKAFRSRSP